MNIGGWGEIESQWIRTNIYFNLQFWGLDKVTCGNKIIWAELFEAVLNSEPVPPSCSGKNFGED